MSVSRSYLIVSDIRTIQVFTLDGEFIGTHPVARRQPGVVPRMRRILAFKPDVESLRAIAWSVDDGVYIAAVYALRGDTLASVFIRKGARIPTNATGVGVVRGIHRQALPTGTLHGSCAYIQDGGPGWIYRYDIESRSIDSLVPPRYPVPPYIAPEDRAMHDGLQNVMPQGLSPGDLPELTELQHWIEMTVDPDGHIWMRPWAPAGAGHSVFIVNPVSGESRQVTVPVFPRAFGAPGVYFGVATDSLTDVAYVVRVE